MKIGITSQNKLKVEAVRNAYSFMEPSPEISGYSADSGVGEQPINEQTLQGARNRIADLRKRVDGLDRIISIESGIFHEGDKWLDKAVIVILDTSTGKEYVAYSDAVVFLDKYVEMAREMGFDTTTVGRVMANEGFIENAKDPHQSISGVSRRVYIEETVKGLVEEIEK